MTHKLWLSVLIPVYNSADYLEECINSILDQEVEGLEIILYNDGSTDPSDEICKEFSSTHPAIIRYIHGIDNKGIAAARNALLKHALGTYIWFIDSDDYLLPNSINSVRKIAAQYSPDIVMCDYVKSVTTARKSFSGRGGVFSTDRQALIRGVFQYRKMYCWQKVIKKTLFDKVSPFPKGKIFEDIYVVPQLLFASSSFFYLAKPCINYRVRDGSIMAKILRDKGSFSIDKHQDLLCALQQLPELNSAERPLDKETVFWMSNYVAREYIKLAKRYRKRTAEVDFDFAQYKADIESCSPLTFRQLRRQYLKRGKLITWAKLQKAL